MLSHTLKSRCPRNKVSLGHNFLSKALVDMMSRHPSGLTSLTLGRERGWELGRKGGGRTGSIQEVGIIK